MRRLRQLIRDQSGASAVEYGLILALGVGLALVLFHFFSRTLHSTTDAARMNDNPNVIHEAPPDAGFIKRSVVVP